MRVLAMFHAYAPLHGAGAEWHAHYLLRGLAARGHDVVVLLSRPIPMGSYDFQGIHVVGWRGKGDPFDQLPADVIVTHLENTPRATVIGQMRRIPVVHLLHNTFGPTRDWLSRPSVALGVANSEWMAADFARHVLRSPSRRMIIARPRTPVADYGTTPGDLVTMVNLFENKGGRQFWDIARAMPRTRFLAVLGGYGEQVIPDPVPGNVELIGNTQDMRRDVYARTRVLLMPSEYESWGRVGVEAMCSGIPVIAHPTPGLLESLASAGTYADRDDTAAWVSAIRRLSTRRAWDAASGRALARARELDAGDDLPRFCDSVEALARPSARIA